jgi:thiol-disulfide isomerase/thioredoxin
MKKLAILMVVAAAGLAALAVAQAAENVSHLGKTPPEIQAAYWMNGSEQTLAALKGKVVIVEFWATWCPPCRKSIPHLIDLNKKYADKGVVIIGLTDEAKETVEPFVKQMKMDYLVGGGSKSGNQYGIAKIPTSFVIDTTGKVAWQGYPMDAGLDKAIEAEVAKIKTDAPKK